MNLSLKTIADSAMSAVHHAGFEAKKHSPEIFIVVGVVGVVVGTVMACKATMKVSEVVEESKNEIEEIRNDDSVDERETNRQLAIAYVRTGLRFVRLYGPSVVVGAASLTAIVTSHNIMQKRNLALSAAYASVYKGFSEYRGRVVDRFGDEVDRELRYNIRKEKVTETVTDENGKTKKVKKEIEVCDGVPSVYSRYFDSRSAYFVENPQYNQMFLKAQQSYANQLLQSRGHLFLNEVYDMLGFDRCAEGQVLGWIYDKHNPDKQGHVDFGIFNLNTEENREFANGYSPIVLLDFNPMGDIMNDFTKI